MKEVLARLEARAEADGPLRLQHIKVAQPVEHADRPRVRGTREYPEYLGEYLEYRAYSRYSRRCSLVRWRRRGAAGSACRG